MTSPRHTRSPLHAALQWAVVVYAGLAGLAAQGVQTPPAPPPAPVQRAQPGPQQAAAPALVPEWATSLPEASLAPPAHDGERIFVPLRDGTLVAIELASGKIAWQTKTPPGARVIAGGGLLFAAYPSLVVALDPGSVFPLYPAGILALDARTGEERWRRVTEGAAAAPPAWNNGWLLVGTTDGRLTMLRAEGGKPLWDREVGASLRPGVQMTGDRLYVLLEDRRVVALTLDRGEPLWERKLSGNGTTLTALDDRVFVGADDRFFYCLAAEDGDVKWRWRAGGAILGTPVVDQDSIYFLSLDNVLRSLDRGNGHQRWKRGLSFRPIAGPVAAGDLLLVPGLAPEIPAFRATTGAPAGKITLDAELTALPIMLPSGEPGTFSLVVVTGEAVQRLGPAPPLLESHPVPGVPLFLELPKDSGVRIQDSGDRAVTQLVAPRSATL